jgi:hypothetical protein
MNELQTICWYSSCAREYEESKIVKNPYQNREEISCIMNRLDVRVVSSYEIEIGIEL